MKKNRIFYFLLLISFIQNSYAEDSSYFLPGKSSKLEIEELDKGDTGYYLPGYVGEENAMEEDEKELLYLLPGFGKEIDPEIKEDKTFIVSPSPEAVPEFSVGNIKDENVGQLPAGSKALEKPGFESMDNWDKLNKVREQANNSLTFAALLDNYNYGGQPGVYDQLFEGDKANFINKFFFQGSYQITFLKKFFLLSSGLNLGVSYKTGKGDFSDGQQSEITIVLWAIPVDVPLTIQIPVGSFLRIEGSVGPSLMTLLQNRDDRDEGEAGKDTYQLSPGYFASGRLKINWGNIWKSSALALFNSNEVTNFFLNFEARYESYNKFSDQLVKVDGTSFGLGLSFEFL